MTAPVKTVTIDMHRTQNRHRDAVQIDDGACNPIAISRALVRAVEECRDTGQQIDRDEAVRLIVHQLAHICGVLNFEDHWTARTHCETTAENRKDEPYTEYRGINRS